MKGKKVAVKIVTVQVLAVSPCLEDDDRSIDPNPQQSPYGGRQSQQCGVWKDLFLDIICTSRAPPSSTHRTSAFVQLSDLRDARAALRHLPILGLRVFKKNSSKTNIFLSSISQFFKHLEWNPPSGHYNCGHLNTQQNYTEKVTIKVCFLALLTRFVFFLFLSEDARYRFSAGVSPPGRHRQLTTGL